MKAKHLLASFVRERYRRSWILPSYMPDNWFECDLFEATKSGYWNEYEIKVSRSDFFADAKKGNCRNNSWTSPGITLGNKHKILAERDRGPNRFYFVTAKDIVGPEDIPEWAGWFEARSESLSSVGMVGLKKRKLAPRRHNNKLDPRIKEHAESVIYYRLMNKIMREGATK